MGVVLTGLGLCLTTEASIIRFKGEENWTWLLLGTAGLVVFNTGLSFLGDAVKYRVFYEYRLKKEKRRTPSHDDDDDLS